VLPIDAGAGARIPDGDGAGIGAGGWVGGMIACVGVGRPVEATGIGLGIGRVGTSHA